MKSKILISIAFAILFFNAYANDTASELAIGGLVFTKTNKIVMEKEELYISESKVKVKYVFYNKTNKPVKLRVAFPIPEIFGGEGITEVPGKDASNPVDFVTKVNNKNIKLNIEQKAMAKGKDQKALLQKYGISLLPDYKHMNAKEKLKHVSAKEINHLIEVGLFLDNGVDSVSLVSNWGLYTTYHWEQTFPAKQRLIIEHEYKPIIGFTTQTEIGGINYEGYSSDTFYKDYCISPALWKKLKQIMRAEKLDYPPFYDTTIAYILKTGANWAEPIRVSFRNPQKCSA